MPTFEPTDVRKWAREHGLTTAERGRLPKTVLEAYAAAHSGDETEGKTGPSKSEGARSAANADTAAARASETRAAGSRAGKAAARTGKGRQARTSPVKSRQSARPTAQTAAPRHDLDLEERLTAVETQLATAVARLEILEGKMTKSLLGLRVTL